MSTDPLVALFGGIVSHAAAEIVSGDGRLTDRTYVTSYGLVVAVNSSSTARVKTRFSLTLRSFLPQTLIVLVGCSKNFVESEHTQSLSLIASRSVGRCH